MASQIERGHALLKSLCAPHVMGDEHAWRQCRACLASEELGHFHASTGMSAAQRELQAVLEHYNALAAKVSK